ncbi:MAG: hypothetical protein ACKVJG_18835 [Candidatus Latescibacterota bacterium]|jgi:hypothetical protein
MTTDAWEDFGWQGLRLRAPEDWNLGRVDGDFEKGYARLDDAEIVRAEIEWRQLKGRESSVPLSDLVDRYLAGLEKKAKKAGTSFELQRRARFLKDKTWLEGVDYEVFTWDADFRAFNLALRFTDTRRVVLLRVLCHFNEQMPDFVERVFRSLVDESGQDRLLWSIYGLRFYMPKDYKLTSHDLKSGHIQLHFEKGKDECRVHRLSMARFLLKGSELAHWYPDFFKKHLRDFQVEIIDELVCGHGGLRVEGRPRSRWRQLLRPLPFVNPRPRLFLNGRVWYRQDLDKIGIVEHLYRKRDESTDIVNMTVNGHFIEETEAEPGRHAGVAADAQ